MRVCVRARVLVLLTKVSLLFSPKPDNLLPLDRAAVIMLIVPLLSFEWQVSQNIDNSPAVINKVRTQLVHLALIFAKGQTDMNDEPF